MSKEILKERLKATESKLIIAKEKLGYYYNFDISVDFQPTQVNYLFKQVEYLLKKTMYLKFLIKRKEE